MAEIYAVSIQSALYKGGNGDMNLVFAMDNRGGLFFKNHRQRRSRDLRDDLINNLINPQNSKQEKKNYLRLHPDSRDQFENKDDTVIKYSENYLCDAKDGDYCFVDVWDENGDTKTKILNLIRKNKVEKIVIYHWVKTYPADTFMDPELSLYGWFRSERLSRIPSKTTSDEAAVTCRRDIWERSKKEGVLDFKFCFEEGLHYFTNPFHEKFPSDVNPEKYEKLSTPVNLQERNGEKGKQTKRHSRGDRGDYDAKCHIIAIQLSPFISEDDKKSIHINETFPGTNSLNCDMMLPFENFVADYLAETDGTVTYEVTLYFESDPKRVVEMHVTFPMLDENNSDNLKEYRVILKNGSLEDWDQNLDKRRKLLISNKSKVNPKIFEKTILLVNERTKRFHLEKCNYSTNLKSGTNLSNSESRQPEERCQYGNDQEDSKKTSIAELLQSGKKPCQYCIIPHLSSDK